MASKNWLALLTEHNIPLIDVETLEELDFSVERCSILPEYTLNDKIGNMIAITMITPMPGECKLNSGNFIRVNLFYHLPKNEEGYTPRYILEIIKDCKGHYIDTPQDALENFDKFLDFIVKGGE